MNIELGLVCLKGAVCPMVCQIDEPGTFQHQQDQISGVVGEFSAQNRANFAGLADTVSSKQQDP